MPRPDIHPVKEAKRLRMMLAGKSGFGKTVFCGTAPNALFLTTDPEGTASAARFGSKAQEIEIHNQDELNDAYVFLEQGGIEELGLDFVIVDNITEVQAQFMDRAIALAVAQGKKKGIDRNPFIPDRPEYQVEQNATVDFVKKMCALDVHVIFTSHLKGMEDGDANDYYSIAVRGQQGAIAEQCLGYMNVIGMGAVVEVNDKTVRRLYFDHVRQYRGKDRIGGLGKFQDNINVPIMMEKLGLVSTLRGASAPAAKPRPRPRAK